MVTFDNTYYEKIILDYGYNPLYFQSIDFNLGTFTKEDLQKMWICHHGGNEFANIISQEKSILTTGFGLSGTPHMGTISQIMKAVKLQQQGHNVQIVLGDLDAYNGKKMEYPYTQDLVERYKEFINRIGFDSKKGIVRSQSESSALTVLRTASYLANYISDEMFENAEEDLHDFYSRNNKVENSMTFNRKFSLNLMIADFIDLFISDGYRNIMVFLGIDEHQYVLAAIKTLESMKQTNAFNVKELNFSAIYSRIIKGFNNYPKMSKSFPDSSIHVSMNSADIYKRIVQEEGGYLTPYDNIVFQMICESSYFTILEINQAFAACEQNPKSWERWKHEYALQISDILSKWPSD